MLRFFFIGITVLLGRYEIHAQLQGDVNYDALGISFTIPQGWVGQELDEMVILGSNTIPGLVIISTHSLSKEELIQEARAGIYDQNGTQLQLNGELKTLGTNAVAGVFTGTMEYETAKGYIIGVANPNSGGMGVNILSVTSPELFGQANIDVADQLYRSFRFKKIDKTAEIAQWKDWLSNVRLTYMDSYSSSSYTDGGISGGYSTESRIDLCAAGHFKQSGNSQMTFGGDGVSGYNSGNSAGQGTWKVISRGSQLVLVLKYHSGEEESYTLEYTDEKLYLNGRRYFRTTEGEYAPNCP